jgi:hypothetical protein
MIKIELANQQAKERVFASNLDFYRMYGDSKILILQIFLILLARQKQYIYNKLINRA